MSESTFTQRHKTKKVKNNTPFSISSFTNTHKTKSTPFRYTHHLITVQRFSNSHSSSSLRIWITEKKMRSSKTSSRGSIRRKSQNEEKSRWIRERMELIDAMKRSKYSLESDQCDMVPPLELFGVYVVASNVARLVRVLTSLKTLIPHTHTNQSHSHHLKH